MVFIILPSHYLTIVHRPLGGLHAIQHTSNLYVLTYVVKGSCGMMRLHVSGKVTATVIDKRLCVRG